MIYSEISNKARFGVILITGAILVVVGLICSSYVFDCEGPSGEAMQLEKTYEYNQGKEAYDKVQEGSQDERDMRDARDFANDNMCWR